MRLTSSASTEYVERCVCVYSKRTEVKRLNLDSMIFRSLKDWMNSAKEIEKKTLSQKRKLEKEVKGQSFKKRESKQLCQMILVGK